MLVYAAHKSILTAPLRERPFTLPTITGSIVMEGAVELATFLQIMVFFERYFSPAFRLLAWVAARLLHTERARQDSNVRPSLLVA